MSSQDTTIDQVDAEDAAKNSMTDQVSLILSLSIVAKEWKFYLNERELSPRECVASNGILPAIAWHADKLHQSAYGGISTGVSFEQDPLGAIGVPDAWGTRVNVPHEPGRPRSPILLFCLEVLYQAQENYPYYDGASIDHLVQSFLVDHERNVIPWSGQKPASQEPWVSRLE
jgi:hypothetical protein